MLDSHRMCTRGALALRFLGVSSPLASAWPSSPSSAPDLKPTPQARLSPRARVAPRPLLFVSVSCPSRTVTLYSKVP
eukprot:1599865-Pleurochrysis_carterae.AAC.1